MDRTKRGGVPTSDTARKPRGRGKTRAKQDADAPGQPGELPFTEANVIGGRQVAQVFIDTEFLDEPQGWYVGGAADPRSYLVLATVNNLTNAQIQAAGWDFDQNVVMNWFANTFNVASAAVHTSQNTRPWHSIP